MSLLVPARRRGVELLDDPNVDPAVRERSIGDVTRSNRWLGGLSAARGELRAAVRSLAGRATLVDVGTGLADIPARARRDAARHDLSLTVIGVDEAPTLLAAAQRAGRIDHAVCADARALPFRDGAVDVAFTSQLLHHFPDDDVQRVIAELDRIARRRVVLSDLRRSWLAAAGFWIVSFPLRFHRVTRHDGVVSVLRGFTARELSRLVQRGANAAPRVRRRLGYRLVASWAPRASA